jgi:hypothetical protein
VLPKKEHDQRPDGEELALPVLHGPIPKLAGAHEFKDADHSSVRRGRLDGMARIVLRVRLVGGDLMDLTYEDPEADESAMINRAISTLSTAEGALRCRHGDRLVVLYGRGVAAIEVSPRGAVV